MGGETSNYVKYIFFFTLINKNFSIIILKWLAIQGTKTPIVFSSWPKKSFFCIDKVTKGPLSNSYFSTEQKLNQINVDKHKDERY